MIVCLQALTDQFHMQIYLAGARNFLVINVPALSYKPPQSSIVSRQILRWNEQLVNLVSDFRSSHPGSTIFEFDLYSFINQVIDDPSVFPATTHYKETTKPCSKYMGDYSSLDLFDEECGFALDEYLWHDNLHPTMPFHKALASQLAEFLRNQAPVKVPKDVLIKEDLSGADIG